MKSVQKKCGRVISARLPKRWLALGACLIFVSTTVFLFAYTHEQDDANNTPVATKWCNGNLNNGLPCTNTVNWSMGPTGTNVDTVGGPTIIQAIQNAFASWQDAGESDHQSGPAQFEDRAGFPGLCERGGIHRYQQQRFSDGDDRFHRYRHGFWLTAIELPVRRLLQSQRDLYVPSTILHCGCRY